MERQPDEFNEMGSFVCDVMMKYSDSDLCLCNPGMIRIDFRKGNLTYDIIFEAIPFENIISSALFTGEDLFKVFKTLYSSKMSLYIQKGFQVNA